MKPRSEYAAASARTTSRGLRWPELTPNRTRLLSVCAFIVLWEIFGRQVNPILMSYPTAIVAALLHMIASGELLVELGHSLRPFLLGFGGAIVIGIILGILMGAYRRVEYALDPFVNALYATPNVALIPLFILWLGLGLAAKVAIVFFVAFFPIVVATFGGVKNISASLVEVGRVFGFSKFDLFRKIVLPGSVPFIVTGVRLAVGRAVVGIVVAEFFTAIDGLGGLIILYSNRFETDYMFVPIIVLALMGVFLTEAVKVFERKVASWKETERVSF